MIAGPLESSSSWTRWCYWQHQSGERGSQHTGRPQRLILFLPRDLYPPLRVSPTTCAPESRAGKAGLARWCCRWGYDLVHEHAVPFQRHHTRYKSLHAGIVHLSSEGFRVACRNHAAANAAAGHGTPRRITHIDAASSSLSIPPVQWQQTKSFASNNRDPAEVTCSSSTMPVCCFLLVSAAMLLAAAGPRA